MYVLENSALFNKGKPYLIFVEGASSAISFEIVFKPSAGMGSPFFLCCTSYSLHQIHKKTYARHKKDMDISLETGSTYRSPIIGC